MFFRKFGYEQTFKGILVDTNLLLLLLTGIFDRELIKNFKRTQIFDKADFDNLTFIISKCNNQLYTTPNILTELTNLTGTINKDFRFYRFLHAFMHKFIEINTDSQTIMTNSNIAFLKLGLTDASIMNLASDDILIVTVDLDLYHLLSSHSKPVINYNYIKFPQ